MKFLFKISFLSIISFLIFNYLKKSTPECHIFKNAKVFDSEKGVFLDTKIFTIQNDTFTSIELEKSNTFENKNCAELDLANKFVIPSLIDSHSHLFLNDLHRTYDWHETMLKSSNTPYWPRIFLAEKSALSMIYSGFSTVRDLGNSGQFLDEILNTRLRFDSKLKLLKFIYSGPALSLYPTQIHSKPRSGEYIIIDEKTDIEKTVLSYRDKKIPWIKIYADNSDSKFQYTDRNLLKRIVDMARKLNIKTAIHAEFKESIANALFANPDSIEHFYDVPILSSINAPDFTGWVVLTNVSTKYCGLSHTNCSEFHEQQVRRTDWLKKNNFKIVFGSDSVFDFSSKSRNRGRDALENLMSLSEIGLTSVEILLAATKNSAEMLNLNTGKIKVGSPADFIVLSQDPLDNILNLTKQEMIWLGGKPVCTSLKDCSNGNSL